MIHFNFLRDGSNLVEIRSLNILALPLLERTGEYFQSLKFMIQQTSTPMLNIEDREKYNIQVAMIIKMLCFRLPLSPSFDQI